MSLQIDDLEPEVTEFAVQAARLLGLELTGELDKADEWLSFDFTAACLKAVEEMPPGQVFTARDIMAACNRVNSEALIL